jgi:hypothetical protein
VELIDQRHGSLIRALLATYDTTNCFQVRGTFVGFDMSRFRLLKPRRLKRVSEHHMCVCAICKRADAANEAREFYKECLIVLRRLNNARADLWAYEAAHGKATLYE